MTERTKASTVSDHNLATVTTSRRTYLLILTADCRWQETSVIWQMHGLCATRGVRPFSVFISRVAILNVSRKYNTDDDLQHIFLP